MPRRNKNTLDPSIIEFGSDEPGMYDFGPENEVDDPDLSISKRIGRNKDERKLDINNFNEVIKAWTTGIFKDRPIEEAPLIIVEEVRRIRNREQ